jgi:hypothetical protein
MLDLAQLLQATFDERQAQIFQSTSVRASFVVRNSTEGTALRPAHAAFIESLDFVKFFDQIKHGQHALVPSFRTNDTSHYTYSTLGHTTCYYQTNNFAANYIDHYGWRDADLTAAISGYDIQQAYQEWLQPDGPDKDEAIIRRRHAAQSNEGHQSWRHARTMRMMHNIRSGTDLITSSYAMRLAVSNASKIATLAATVATNYSAFIHQMTLRFTSMAAIYSCALVARHAATASTVRLLICCIAGKIIAIVKSNCAIVLTLIFEVHIS